eukprot:scaffold136486_cov142-Phaeocystis_antarctica.AAC.1
MTRPIAGGVGRARAGHVRPKKKQVQGFPGALLSSTRLAGSSLRKACTVRTAPVGVQSIWPAEQ